MTITQNKRITTRQTNETVLAVNVYVDEHGEHRATVRKVGGRATTGAPASRGPHSLPASGHRTRERSSRASAPGHRRTARATGAPSSSHAAGSAPPSTHRLSFQVVLLGGGGLVDVQETGQKAKAVNASGDVCWTGRVSGPHDYATETTSLTEAQTAGLLGSIHSYHVDKGISAPTSAPRPSQASRRARSVSTEEKERVYVAYGRNGHGCCWSRDRAVAAESASKGGGFVKSYLVPRFTGDLPKEAVPFFVEPPKGAKTPAAKKVAKKAARQANAAAKTSRASKARSFVEVKAGGKVLNVYGPFAKAKAETFKTAKRKELEAAAATPDALSVEVVSASGDERARLARLAEANRSPKGPASKKTTSNNPASKETTTNDPASKKTASKKTASKKTASKKTAAKKTAPKKTASKKTAPKKTAPKKTAAKKTAPKKTVSAKGEPATAKEGTAAAKPPKPRKPRIPKPRKPVVQPASASGGAGEAAPHTMRAPVSHASDEVVFAQFRATIKAEKPTASEAEIDSELAVLKHAWRAGAREKVFAWMRAKGITDVARGFEDWMQHNEADALAVMDASSRAA